MNRISINMSKSGQMYKCMNEQIDFLLFVKRSRICNHNDYYLY